MPITWINKSLLAVTCWVVLSGCTSLDDQIPKDGPDMEDVYNSYAVVDTNTVGSNSVTWETEPQFQQRFVSDTDLPKVHQYTRDASNELEGLFKTHTNPMLFMYTKPHVVGRDGIPVPGYTTQFKMYDRDHFALPGEVQ